MSTVVSSFIVNSVLAEAVGLCLSRGVDVPVYTSGNIPGGAEKNTELIRRYKPRIAAL